MPSPIRCPDTNHIWDISKGCPVREEATVGKCSTGADPCVIRTQSFKPHKSRDFLWIPDGDMLRSYRHGVHDLKVTVYRGDAILNFCNLISSIVREHIAEMI